MTVGDCHMHRVAAGLAFCIQSGILIMHKRRKIGIIVTVVTWSFQVLSTSTDSLVYVVLFTTEVRK